MKKIVTFYNQRWIGRQKLAVRVTSQGGKQTIDVTEHVRNGKNPYRAAVIDGLSKKQALTLGLLLLKVAQA
jgi:ribonuclease PH